MPTVAQLFRSVGIGAYRQLKAVLVVCVVLLIVFVIAFRMNSGTEFHDLSGAAAKESLEEKWPASVDPNSVASVSYKSQSTIDSCSSWFRIELDEASASIWADAVHTKAEDMARGGAAHDGPVEGVRRITSGPPPLHRQTGSTPTWWAPPSANCRATEFMAWYKYYDSGVGWALYSVFDPSTKTLWIYSNSAQHDLLWHHGEVPPGTPIAGLKSTASQLPKPTPPPSR